MQKNLLKTVNKSDRDDWNYLNLPVYHSLKYNSGYFILGTQIKDAFDWIINNLVLVNNRPHVLTIDDIIMIKFSVDYE